MDATDVLKTLADEVRSLSRTETIVGEAISVEGGTVIPVSRLTVGFGGGAGSGEGGGEDKNQRGAGSGGGGGGGVRVEPAAFIVAKDGELSILAAPGRRGALAELFERVPDLVEKMAAAKAKAEGDGAGDAGGQG